MIVDNNDLIPVRAITNLLGGICLNPSYLTTENGRQLVITDFQDSLFENIFKAINNIYIDNVTVKHITAIDIDNFLSSYPTPYKVFVSRNGYETIEDMIRTCNVDLLDSSFETVKKFSLLRNFNNMGFDTREIWDAREINLDEKSRKAAALKEMTLEQIVEHFTLKLINVKNEWNIQGNQRSYEVSDGLDNLLEELQKNPDLGHPYLNKVYNTIFRGMRKGKLMIKSAGTGVGKTRTALADMVSISCPYIWDMDKGKYIENGISFASNFISTELDKLELQTCLIAIISGVPENEIKEGKYSDMKLARISQAIEILKQSPITLHYINDFSINDIEQIIEKDILEKNVKYVFFDYLQITPKLSRTIQEQFAMGLREDSIMLNFSSRLKNMAEKYEVYISTATQLNRNSNDITMRDATAVRGGSAQIDKADHAIQLYKTTEQDLAKVKEIIEALNCPTPNFMHVIYKNRSGQNNIIVWTVMNHANMREQFCFCTDKDYNFVEIGEREIEFLG